jgi:hypothetical protein
MVEKEAKDATVCILDWVQESCVMSGGVLGLVAGPAVGFIKPIALQLEDKIDGVEGN